MSERLTEVRASNPADMASALLRLHGINAIVNPKTEQAAEPAEGPCEGKRVEIDGQTYEYAKVPTGKMVFNRETCQMEPGFHSLRTWYSHSTDEAGPGPGWDMRMDLRYMTPKQEMERHGHVFTWEEILAPSGRPESFGGPLVGGMPTDIPYYELQLVTDESEE